MKYTAAVLGLLSLAVLKAEGVQLSAKTAKGRLRQTALLLGIPSWTARISHQKAVGPSSLKSPFCPIIPTLARDPAYATSPLFRRARSQEEDEIDDTSFASNTLPDISVLHSLRRKHNKYKEVLIRKILVLALIIGIGLAPIFASPQRAQATDMTMFQKFAPEVSMVANNHVTFRLNEQEGTFLEQNVLKRIIKGTKMTELSHVRELVSSVDSSGGGVLVDQTLEPSSPFLEQQQQQTIEHQARGGHNDASTTIITNEVGKQVRLSIPYFSLKITALAVLVVAAAMGGLEEATNSLRNRLENEWARDIRSKISTSKKIDFDAGFSRFLKDKSKKIDFDAVFSRFLKDKTDDNKVQKPKSFSFTPSDPAGVWKLKQIQMRIRYWEQQGRHKNQKFMLQKSSDSSKKEWIDHHIKLKRSEPQDPVEARSSPLFSGEPQTSKKITTPPPQHQQSSPWDIPSWTSELQSKYSKKYVALQRNPDSPLLLTYRIGDRPNKPKQPTVSIGLKRSNTTATVY